MGFYHAIKAMLNKVVCLIYQHGETFASVNLFSRLTIVASRPKTNSQHFIRKIISGPWSQEGNHLSFFIDKFYSKLIHITNNW